VQAHAFDHYILGRCDGRFPIADARTTLRCPLCLRWLPRSEFNLEHAPQRSKQSRLGPPWVLVSSCETCNSKIAGKTFESEAAMIARDDAAHPAGAPGCVLHGTEHPSTGFDLGWIVDHVPVTLADLKSAYIIAFAVLGYSWVCSRRLEPIREAFAARQLPPEDVAFATCGVFGPQHERTVFEICTPFSAIVVVGPSADVVVVFATDSTIGSVRTLTELTQGGSVRGHRFDWPLMVRKTQLELGLPDIEKPEQAWDNGHTFHLDRCAKPHRESVAATRESTRSINARFRGR